ncbi:MAG: MarR family winged helix-turn-helix transcriptional regulator [Solirubrobacterales bacterium]
MSRQSKQELLNAISDQFRISQNWSDAFDEIASEILGINRTDMRVIDIVERRGRATAGEVAKEAALTTGGVTAVVDRLEKLGYLKRVRDPDDRRRVWVEPTPELWERAGKIWAPLSDRWESRARNLSRDQLEFILSFLAEGNEMMAGEIERVRAMRDRT